MNVAIIGYGTQGKKRYKELINRKINIYIIDPYFHHTNYKKLSDLNKNIEYAFVCTPDNKKYQIIKYLINKNIKILVEKPLYFETFSKYKNILKLLNKYNFSKLYVAYNHRFEPNIIRLKKYLNQKKIGDIYLIEMYYGNGTSLLWKKSLWRSKEKKGVIYDLAPHLLDIYLYLFGNLPKKSFFFNKSKFENKCIDYAEFGLVDRNKTIKFSTSLIDWKNKFYINIIGSKGSLHVESLCKWSDSIFKYRKRVVPSGVPIEKIFIEKKNDPTWKLEHNYFFNNLKYSNFENDILIKKYIDNLFNE
tara:strand:+ start:713 stop:1624 length:912 start_codon:yes stop_codon:yes gene_type:complete